MHSIEFKFGVYITGHRRTNPIDFGENRMNSFLQEYKKEFLYNTAYEINFFKVHFIKLIFGVYITDHRPIYCIDFGEFQINSFLQEYKKEFLYITAYGVKL